MTERPQSDAKKWIDEAEAALNRTAEALRAAWEGTRESRTRTLEAARDAASQLGKAIDEGLEVARDTWSSRSSDPGDATGSGEEE